jgi:hypothetical protein
LSDRGSSQRGFFVHTQRTATGSRIATVTTKILLHHCLKGSFAERCLAASIEVNRKLWADFDISGLGLIMVKK